MNNIPNTIETFALGEDASLRAAGRGSGLFFVLNRAAHFKGLILVWILLGFRVW